MICPLVPEIFFVELYVVRFSKRQILLLKGSSPMMFDLMIDFARDRGKENDTFAKTLINRPYGTGRVLFSFSQALRARLPSF